MSFFGQPPKPSGAALFPNSFAPGNSFNASTNILNASTNQSQTGPIFGSTSQNNNPNNSGAKIDLDHLRPTTKYDQLTDALQKEILDADAEILAQIKNCEEVETIIPTVAHNGQGLPPQVDLVRTKYEQVQEGWEGDAEDIDELREKYVKKAEGEAKLVWKAVERLKAPAQYQLGPGVSASQGPGGGGSVYGSSTLGLSGWWNNPQTLRGTLRAGGSSRGIQVPDEEDADTQDTSPDPRIRAPSSLVDLFDRRAGEMQQTLSSHKSLLGQIEDFIDGIEDKIRTRERDFLDKTEYGYGRGGDEARGSEKAEQLRLLKYVFGEAERSLYEVAGKIGEVRDGVVDVVRKGG